MTLATPAGTWTGGEVQGDDMINIDDILDGKRGIITPGGHELAVVVTDLGKQLAEQYDGRFLCDDIMECADGAVDIYNSDLAKWVAEGDNHAWYDEVKTAGLLEGVDNFYKMIQIMQFECYEQELYDQLDDIVAYHVINDLKDKGVTQISAGLLEDVLDACENADNNRGFEDYRDEAADLIENNPDGINQPTKQAEKTKEAGAPSLDGKMSQIGEGKDAQAQDTGTRETPDKAGREER